MGLFTALFASRRGARTLVLDAWRIGDSRAASYSLTRSIRSDYLDPLYARLAYEARKLWLDFQAESGEPFLIECGCLNIARASVTPALSETYAEQSYRVLQGLDLKTRAFDRVGLHARFPQFDADIGVELGKPRMQANPIEGPGLEIEALEHSVALLRVCFRERRGHAGPGDIQTAALDQEGFARFGLEIEPELSRLIGQARIEGIKVITADRPRQAVGGRSRVADPPGVEDEGPRSAPACEQGREQAHHAGADDGQVVDRLSH